MKKYSGKQVVYCANPGNAGDALIAHATFQLFEKLDIKFEIITHEEIVNDKIIFYAGGDNLVEGKYKNAVNFIRNNYRRNHEIILLPHTVLGYNELLLLAKYFTIFCREKTSYQNFRQLVSRLIGFFLPSTWLFNYRKWNFRIIS